MSNVKAGATRTLLCQRNQRLPGPAISQGKAKLGHKFAIVATLVCSLDFTHII